MKIVIDARCVSRKMHGIARYTLNLILHLTRIDTKSSYYILHTKDVSPALFGEKGNLIPVLVNLKLYSVSEQFMLPSILRKINPDIYHSPTFSAPVCQPCPVVMTIHDMIHLSHKTALSFFYRVYYLLCVKKAATKARKVITVSEFSKKEISRLLKLPEKKIAVTYNGISEAFYKKELPSEKQTQLNPGYWLFIGNEKPHKNVTTLLKAYTLARERSESTPPLVLGGVSKNFLLENLGPSIFTHVIPLTIKSDDELVSAYKNASLFIAPSILEGFGFPVLEAMASETPVITSDIPVIREVVGEDAAIFVDPLSCNSLSEAMVRVNGDNALKLRMKKSGLERARLFRWEKAATQTLEVYHEALNLQKGVCPC